MFGLGLGFIFLSGFELLTHEEMETYMKHLSTEINLQKGSSRANSDKITTRICTEIGLNSIKPNWHYKLTY